MDSNNVNPVIVTEKVDGSVWLSKLRSHVLQSSPISSGDIEARTTPNGTTLHIKPEVFGLFTLNYKYLNEGLYTLDTISSPNINLIDPVALIAQQLSTFFTNFPDISDSSWWEAPSAYGIGDFKRVHPLANPSIAVPGSWVCVSPVPRDYTAVEIAAINGISDPNIRTLAQAGFRKPGVNYNPRWPEPRQIAHKTTDGKGRYWEMIGMFPTTMSLCNPVTEQLDTWFIPGFLSSSLSSG